MKRKLKWFFLFIPIMIGTLLLAGSVYQMVGVRADQKRLKPVGQLVEINGRSMHLYTEGTGDVTVVFSAGWGTVQPYVDYYPLYSKLSSHVKIAVYDRFGTGFSDLTDRKRDVDLIVEEVHTLLEKSGQKPPYVFVAHSFGSLETIRYAQRFPNEVRGILILDGGTPEYYADTTPITAVSYVQRFLVNTGIARILGHSDRFIDSLNDERNGLQFVPEHLRELDRIATFTVANNRNITDEMRHSRTNAKKILEGEKPLHIPLTALTAEDFGNAPKSWLESQQKWKNWSSVSKLTVIKDSKHYIHQYQPDIVAEEIIQLVNR